MVIFPPVAKLDIAADSDSEGRGFESLRAGQKIQFSLLTELYFPFFEEGFEPERV